MKKSSILLSFWLLFPARAFGDAFGAAFGSGSWDTIAAIMLLPYALSLELDHNGFARYPYQLDKGYEGARIAAVSARSSAQRTREGQWVHHHSARLRGSAGIGADASASFWRPGTLDAERTAGYFAAHMTANYVQTPSMLLDFGMGIAVLDHPNRVRPQGGFSDELVFEAFPFKPITLHARYHGALLHDYGYNDLSASLGLTYRWFAVSAGYRALFSPWGQQDGPEFTFQAWF